MTTFNTTAIRELTRVGKDLFSQFVQHMDDCYDETLTDMVIMTEPTDRRVACEFVVNGVYKEHRW